MSDRDRRTRTAYKMAISDVGPQMRSAVIGATGVAIVLVATRSLVLTFRRGSFWARGHRLVRRSKHPIMFWANLTGIGVVSIVGLGLIAWAVANH
jgi:hypothetical protein